ncbi:TIGR01906 family membrane protein [Clostridium sediminicola]|uniref:TIGR01906 family membrane protein n=1 Tax=Clostridium sediminicola TaxID=3114879 RepID=UPI0031F2460B
MRINSKLMIGYEVILTLMLTIILIVASSKFVLKFKPIYYYDVVNLNISEQTDYTNIEIKQNYDYIVHYVGSLKNIDFELPSINFSQSGKQHFKEVKVIYNTLDILSMILLVIFAINITNIIKHKTYNFLKYTSITLLGLPLLLGSFFLINFDKSFTIFHKIFFRNDMWLFNPETDPIINILPQEFFFHSAIILVIILIIFSAIIYYIYRLINNKYIRNSSKYTL